MQERSEVRISQGAEVFEWQGLACYKYNAKLKIAGDGAKVVFYENGIMCGFPKNKLEGEERERSKQAYDKQARFIKTGLAAKRRLHDLVKSNLKVHSDCNGKKQRFKFLTLTFRNDVKDLTIANREFKQFVKRLNYCFTGDASSNFIKYVAVPELQKENERMVWHYHLLLFNMPYIPLSLDVVNRQIAEGSLSADYDKKRNIAYIWGNGSVNIKAVKFSDVYDVASYIAKYIGKKYITDEEGNDTDTTTYEYAEENGLLNKKRFLHSEGLFLPKVIIAFLNREQRKEIYDYFKGHCKRFKKKQTGDIAKRFEVFSFDSEYIGRLFGLDFRASGKQLEKLEGVFNKYNYGFC